MLGPAIAQWQGLSSCHPGFESQAPIYAFIIYGIICAAFVFALWIERKNIKRPGLAHFFNKIY